MKRLPFYLLLCMPLCGQLNATTALHNGKYQPKKSIYHKGWIDFNKNGIKDIYEDPKARLEDRIEDLLSQMTVDEKTCQMVTLYGYKRVLNDSLPTPQWKKMLWKDGIGAIDEQLNGFQQWGLPPMKNELTWPASNHAWAINEVQRFFVEETRLGIPADFTNEGIRGIESYMATNFPSPIALGHTWNRNLVKEVGYITGREARLLGYTNVYAPILDVARDQRWGRCEETYGESPYLVAEMGVAMVKGLQTDMQVASTAKHFLAYSNNKGAREGMSRVDPQMSRREVEYIHAYPYTRVIQEANILGIMTSYNDYDGFPIQSSHYWLTHRLRNVMGFKGYTVSDSDAVEYLYSKHHTAKDMKEAVLQSVEAGLNVRCTFRSPDSYVLPLRELIQEGAISMTTIDERVRDILRVKFLVGMFDHPYQSDLALADKEVNSAIHNQTSLQASREALVLLKNENQLLPLDKEKIKSIAVCGPNADETSFALGHYGPLATEVTSVLQGLKNILPQQVKINYAKGCELVDANWPESEIIRYSLTDQEKSEIDQAVQAAKESDVAIVVLGGGQRTSGENKSRTSLDLPGRQEELLKAVYATGKPVVLVLINGRPLSINWADKFVPSILESWYAGAHSGQAIAEALFGDYNPGGKLTVTFPKTVGQIPFNFPFKPASQVDGGKKVGQKGNQTRINGPLYSFGHGLSYTTFEYSDMQLSSNAITDKQQLKVTCNIKNTGERSGDEVVQLYIRDVLSSVTTYEKSLRGFERVHLQPGETKTVEFNLCPRDFQLLNADNKWVIEPGVFKIMIGASSEKILLDKDLKIIPYGMNDNSMYQLSDFTRFISASINKNQIRNIMDKDLSTGWKAGAGEYISLELKDNSTIEQLKVSWEPLKKNSRYELQLSNGGGQFLTIKTGDIHSMTNGIIKFPPSSGSEIRILVQSGSVKIAEIDLPQLKNL